MGTSALNVNNIFDILKMTMLSVIDIYVLKRFIDSNIKFER